MTRARKDRFRVHRRPADGGEWQSVFTGPRPACDRWLAAQVEGAANHAHLCLRADLDANTFVKRALRQARYRRHAAARPPRPRRTRTRGSWSLWLRVQSGPWMSLGRFERAGEALDAADRLEPVLADGAAAEWFVRDEAKS